MFGRGICEKYQSRDEKFPESNIYIYIYEFSLLLLGENIKYLYFSWEGLPTLHLTFVVPLWS